MDGLEKYSVHVTFTIEIPLSGMLLLTFFLSEILPLNIVKRHSGIIQELCKYFSNE